MHSASMPHHHSASHPHDPLPDLMHTPPPLPLSFRPPTRVHAGRCVAADFVPGIAVGAQGSLHLFEVQEKPLLQLFALICTCGVYRLRTCLFYARNLTRIQTFVGLWRLLWCIVHPPDLHGSRILLHLKQCRPHDGLGRWYSEGLPRSMAGPCSVPNVTELPHVDRPCSHQALDGHMLRAPRGGGGCGAGM